jgi:HlyD family secretion protein
VSEADVGKLAAGMRASFAVDAYPQDKFDGVIRQIRDAPQNVQNVITYDAVIQVDNAGLKLKPGMTANVTFIYADRQNVLRVPSAALRFRPPPDLLADGGTKPGDGAGGGGGGKKGKHNGKKSKNDSTSGSATASTSGPAPARAPTRSVWILRNGALAEIPVVIGVADGSHVEVESPELAEGDVVITDAIGRSERAEAKRAKAQAAGATKNLF